MRISDNITIYAGMSSQASGCVEKNAEQTGEDKRKAVYGGGLNTDLLQDSVMQRRKEAQEKAMKVVGEAFAGDLVIDEDLEKRRVHMDELEAENKELQDELKYIDEQEEKLKEQYGITEDFPTESSGEYEQRMSELEDIRESYLEKLRENEGMILEENAIIRGTKQERLKHSPMTKAKEQAEEILENAGEDIMDMVVEDAKEQIDKESEEREEQAEKLEEKREEKEAFIEKQQEKRDEQEEFLENIPVEEMLSLEQTKTDIQKEVQQIVDKMKLVAEDIKGAVVDRTL